MRDYARTGGSPPEPHPQEQARAQRSITFPARMTAGGRSPPAYYTATFFPPSPGRHLGAPPSRGGGVCDRPSYEAPSPPGTTDPAPPRPRGSDARPSHPERRRAGGASTDPIGVWVFRYYTDSEDLLARFPSTFLALSPPPGGTELTFRGKCMQKLVTFQTQPAEGARDTDPERRSRREVHPPRSPRPFPRAVVPFPSPRLQARRGLPAPVARGPPRLPAAATRAGRGPLWMCWVAVIAEVCEREFCGATFFKMQRGEPDKVRKKN